VNASGGIDGRPLHFVVFDDQTNPATAVQLEAAIMAKHVPVILGPTSTGSCAAVAPLVKDGVVQYFFSPALQPPAGSTTFAAGNSTRDLARAALRYLRERGWTRIAMITSTDASGEDGERVFPENLKLPENQNLSLVAHERFGTSDVSITAQIAHIKAAQPQALLIWTTGPPFGTVLHAMSDAGLDIPVMVSPADLIRAQVMQYAAFSPSQMYFIGGGFGSHDVLRSGPLHDAQQTFITALRGQNVDAESINTYSWDPALVVVQALRHLGASATAPQLHAYIEQMHDVAGANGLYDFRDGSQRGLGLSSAVVVRWDSKNSTFVAASSGGGAPLKGR
jgi:branched-chain amino acid transport system substrate-binding protein